MRHILGLLSILLIFGCSPTEKTCTLSGTVTYQGKPVEKGSISFLGEKSSEGAEIVDGRYACQVTPGTKTVQITGAKRVPPAKGDDPTLILYEDYIPAKYNWKSTLTVEVQENAEKNFDLK
ncbi:MAG: hypothetical protein Q4D62_05880 [Planctomycetia bacterium]|nr:hypothetical protein [Planctomycetia bacterium]